MFEGGAVVEGEFAEEDAVVVEVEVGADVGPGGGEGFGEAEEFGEEVGAGDGGAVGPGGGAVGEGFAPEEGEELPVAGVEVAEVAGFAGDVDLDEFGAAGEAVELEVEGKGAVGGEEEGFGDDFRGMSR